MKKLSSFLVLMMMHWSAMAQELPIAVCENLLESANCIALDLAATIDEEGIQLSYRWDMGDGTQLEGATVSHCYDRAGTYILSLEVWDEAESLLLEDHFKETIYIRDPVQAHFKMPGQVLVNDTFQLKNEVDIPEGYELVNTTWEFQDERYDGNTIQLSSPGPGEFLVKMHLSLAGNDSVHSVCHEQVLKVESDGLAKKALLRRLDNLNADSLAFMEAVSHLLIYDHSASEHQLIPLHAISDDLLLKPGKDYTLSFWHKDHLLGPQNISTKNAKAAFETYNELNKAITQLSLSDATPLTMMTFEEDKPILTRAGRNAVKNNLKLLKYWLPIGLEIGTFTHTDGFPEQNIRLSELRSKAILKKYALDEQAIVVSPVDDGSLLNTCIDAPFCGFENEKLNRKALFRLSIKDAYE